MKPVTNEPGDKHTLNSSIWGNGYNAFMWGFKAYPDTKSTTGWVRFQNMGTGDAAQAEVYVTYEVPVTNDLKVTFGWTEGGAPRTAANVFDGGGRDQVWNVATGADPVTTMVRFECVPRAKEKAAVRKPAEKPAVPAATPTVPADENEKKAAVFWDMAEAMVKEGQIDNARAMYQELIAKYPDTTFAAKARQRLKEL
jgi:hypothetical protein